MDPAKPRMVKIQFTHDVKIGRGWAEFDTEESALDWRKELSGMSLNSTA